MKRRSIEDFAWLLLTEHHRGITRADADKPFSSFSSSENHYVNDRRRYTQALQIVRMADRYGPDHKLGEEIHGSNKAVLSNPGYDDLVLEFRPSKPLEMKTTDVATGDLEPWTPAPRCGRFVNPHST